MSAYDREIEAVKIVETKRLVIESTKLKDTYYVELPNGYKGYTTANNVRHILSEYKKEVK